MLIKFKHFVGTFVLIFLLLGAWAAGKVVTVQIPEQLPECPVRFIRGTLVAGDGSIWAVGEKESIYRLQIGDRTYEKSWLNMDYYSGFPKGKNFTCIAEDRQGRIWAGTDDSGVAVFNGREWKMYDRSNALNGEHVYALAISPFREWPSPHPEAYPFTILQAIHGRRWTGPPAWWKTRRLPQVLIPGGICGWPMLAAGYPALRASQSICSGKMFRLPGTGITGNSPVSRTSRMVMVCLPISAMF